MKHTKGYESRLTLARLNKFISLRNESEFNTNLQFMIDCDRAGFRVEELGQVKRLTHFPASFYWILPYGILVEHRGKLRLFAK